MEYYEVFPDIERAVLREKQIKLFKREWKDALINAVNAEWKDLGKDLGKDLAGGPAVV